MSTNKNPARIEILENQNSEINSELASIIENYLNYESDTYGHIYNENAASVIVGIPQLSGNELVKSRVEEYTRNTHEITELKMDMVDQSIRAWWLYFGNE